MGAVQAQVISLKDKDNYIGISSMEAKYHFFFLFVLLCKMRLEVFFRDERITKINAQKFNLTFHKNWICSRAVLTLAIHILRLFQENPKTHILRCQKDKTHFHFYGVCLRLCLFPLAVSSPPIFSRANKQQQHIFRGIRLQWFYLSLAQAPSVLAHNAQH